MVLSELYSAYFFYYISNLKYFKFVVRQKHTQNKTIFRLLEKEKFSDDKVITQALKFLYDTLLNS